MAIIVFQHGADGGLGRIGPILRAHAHRLDVRRLDLAGRAGNGAGVPGDYDDVDGVISLGGGMNVSDAATLPWLQAEMDYLRGAHERQLPVVGVCLGAQLIAKALGGEVAPMGAGGAAGAAGAEWGFCPVKQTVAGNTDTILAGVPWSTHQLQMHFQEVSKLPEGATLLMTSAACKVQAYRVGLRTYGFQFHCECTRNEIERFSRDAQTLSEMHKGGITPAEFQRQAAEHYDTFARVSDRLIGNVAAYMFPLMVHGR